MSRKKSLPKYLIVYGCKSCGQESGYTERQKPRCRYCRSNKHMFVVSKQEITPEVMAARLKAVADNMMSNLMQAYEHLPPSNENIVAEDKDAERDLLLLMAKAKELHNKVVSLPLTKPPS